MKLIKSVLVDVERSAGGGLGRLLTRTGRRTSLDAMEHEDCFVCSCN